MEKFRKDRYTILEAADLLAEDDEDLREEIYERMRDDHFREIYNLASGIPQRSAWEIPNMSEASEQFTLSREAVLRYAEAFNLLDEGKKKEEIQQKATGEKKQLRRRIVFRSNGKEWEIGFQGKIMKYKGLIGFKRIHFLLAHPDESFWASQVLETPLNEKTQDKPRKTISNSIRDAFLKIRDRDPEFWKYLKPAISTGYHCMYHPPADRPPLDL